MISVVIGNDSRVKCLRLRDNSQKANPLKAGCSTEISDVSIEGGK